MSATWQGSHLEDEPSAWCDILQPLTGLNFGGNFVIILYAKSSKQIT